SPPAFIQTPLTPRTPGFKASGWNSADTGTASAPKRRAQTSPEKPYMRVQVRTKRSVTRLRAITGTISRQVEQVVTRKAGASDVPFAPIPSAKMTSSNPTDPLQATTKSPFERSEIADGR